MNEKQKLSKLFFKEGFEIPNDDDQLQNIEQEF